jgi:hypothetical protein
MVTYCASGQSREKTWLGLDNTVRRESPIHSLQLQRTLKRASAVGSSRATISRFLNNIQAKSLTWRASVEAEKEAQWQQTSKSLPPGGTEQNRKVLSEG